MNSERHGYCCGAGSPATGSHFAALNTDPRVMGWTKGREYTMLDLATKKTTMVRNLPTDGYVYSFAWSPDGMQLAYIWYDPRAGVAGVPGPAPGGGMMRSNEYEYKVFVAEADGGSPKEVYKVKATSFRAFMWR